MGGSEIVRSAWKNKLRLPYIDTNLVKTELTIWKVDMAEYSGLTELEKKIFRYIIDIGRGVSISDLVAEFPNQTKYSIRSTLGTLLKLNKIIKTGASVSTRYQLNPTSQEMASNMQRAAHMFMEIAKHWPKDKNTF